VPVRLHLRAYWGAEKILATGGAKYPAAAEKRRAPEAVE
jgi:hypothetical protein